MRGGGRLCDGLDFVTEVAPEMKLTLRFVHETPSALLLLPACGEKVAEGRMRGGVDFAMVSTSYQKRSPGNEPDPISPSRGRRRIDKMCLRA
jgi:hypothetical protein